MSSCRQDFLNVQVTDNLFNFITASFSEMIGWVKRFSLDFDSRVFVERFTYRHNRIKIFIFHRKRLRFWYVQTGHYIREKLNKCLTELLITGYGFTIINEVNFSPFDEFWVNNCGTVLEKLLLSVIFVKIFNIRYLSVFQEFFTEVSLSAPGFFVTIGSIFQKYIFRNIDLFMMALGGSFVMKRVSLARMYLFFTGTWRLNILRIMLFYIPKLSLLEVAVIISDLNLVTISDLNLALPKFW